MQESPGYPQRFQREHLSLKDAAVVRDDEKHISQGVYNNTRTHASSILVCGIVFSALKDLDPQRLLHQCKQISALWLAGPMYFSTDHHTRPYVRMGRIIAVYIHSTILGLRPHFGQTSCEGNHTLPPLLSSSSSIDDSLWIQSSREMHPCGVLLGSTSLDMDISQLLWIYLIT
ncbi:hypothetical protein EVAR_64389_1 [Eumeta japonica]|uniref:Uncharacterized protein n=1 Tax=Eumeta variegata TaxID=151549 RepID=A0A4C1SDA0_EUMVA|nr:hypothetical protein EVAR_64389_1 [Eumeta japonica]